MLASVAVAACGEGDGASSLQWPTAGPPKVPADITGTIHELRPGTEDGRSTALVVDDGAIPGEPDRAQVAITPDTLVWLLKGGRGSSLDLAEGQAVSVWFDGPVAESYPPQATAGVIRILLSD